MYYKIKLQREDVEVEYISYIVISFFEHILYKNGNAVC
ncbi:hypothetical protein ND00_04260 [Clostridium sp. L74]|nr:hypothetical protein ND00_04260 [Clostridium sp. L74]